MQSPFESSSDPAKRRDRFFGVNRIPVKRLGTKGILEEDQGLTILEEDQGLTILEASKEAGF